MTRVSSISRTGRGLAVAAVLAALAGVGAGCGGEIKTANSTDHSAAQLFNERCSGCHSLNAANAYGSKAVRSKLKDGERTNGPNFNVRREDRDDVLYAIRNGGFSGAIMPANIVTGREADELASFLAKYSGSSDGPRK